MRRKRATGVWLPPSAYDSVTEPADTPIQNPTQNIIKAAFMGLPNSQGSGSNLNAELVGDFNEELIYGVTPTAEANQNVGTLADAAFGYSLKRIVGKLFIGIEPDNVSENAATTWVVTAGIMVRRVNEAGVPTALETYTDAYDSARDPWVWRRNWVLRNPGATGPFVPQWPNTNCAYGSVADGPHIDQKTRRTVKTEERLFLDISAVAMDGGDEQTTTACYMYWDLRFFGRVFSSAGNRRNATR